MKLHATPLVLALAFFATLADGAGAQALPQTREPTAIAGFFAWRDAVGLGRIFTPMGHGPTATRRLRLDLDAHALENVVELERAESLYRKLFAKLVEVTDYSPADVELRVTSRKGSYCDPVSVRRTIGLVGGKLTIAPETVRSPENASCMMEFEAIRKYEALTRSDVEQAASIAFLEKVVPSVSKLTTMKIARFLSERYEHKGSTFNITSMSDRFLAGTVKGVKREVISDRNYWERLQIIVVFDEERDRIRTRLILDGRYAGGLAAPDDHAYGDMEPTYTDYLVEYGQRLILAIRDLR